MCSEGTVWDQPEGSTGVSRRSLMAALAAAPAAAYLARPLPASAAAIEGAVSMAMHIHSSFSELWGSMHAHLDQASRHGIDVIWWTDHDVKMDGLTDKNVVHFSSLTNETGDGTPWQLERVMQGRHTASSGGGIVATPASPLDTVPGSSLRVAAQSSGTGPALLAYQPANIPEAQTWRRNLTNQTIRIEAYPTAVGVDAWLEVFISSSHHPASGGRSAGTYSLSYRIGGPGRPGTRTAVGRQAVVTLAASPRQWNSLVLRPDQDLEAMFPDHDSRDFSLYTLRFGAVSTNGATASGNFDYLRFQRPTTGNVCLDVQDAVGAAAAAAYPRVTQHQGLEVSRHAPHVNWFGGAISLPDYTGVSKAEYPEFIRRTVVPAIHAGGGLASYNHPYGVGWPSGTPTFSQAAQDQLLRDHAVQLLSTRAAGVDVLEVGYPLRGGVDLAHHLGLWDVLSRNAVFLTGNGVSDDHTGSNYAKPPNATTWTTWAWAGTRTEAALLRALRRGEVWFQDHLGFRGALDLAVDGACPMGSVSVSTAASRTLSATATAVPTGGSLEVYQGVVDYAGAAAPTPNARRIATRAASALTSGTATLTLDTSRSSFVRTVVRNSAGTVVACSNPVWLLRSTPPRGIPVDRAA